MSTALQRIDLTNFKSYKGQHTIGPLLPLSCVIGPNGSGKSNIMDAIGFALGVPVSSMRLNKLRDVIHAECTSASVTVTLLLDSTEYRICRTISIDPTKNTEKSMIQLNENTINETELNAFLSKYNISSQIKNFLVFQHEVEAVAQKRSRELTEMIEAASGSDEFLPLYHAARSAVEDANKSVLSLVNEKRETSSELHRYRTQKKECERFHELVLRTNRERTELALLQLYFIELELNAQKSSLAREESAAKEIAEKYNESISSSKDKKRLFSELHKSHLMTLKKVRDSGTIFRDQKASLEQLRTTIEHLEVRRLKEIKDLEHNRAANTTHQSEVVRLESSLNQEQKDLEKFEHDCAVEDAASHTSLSSSQLQEYKSLRKEADCETVAIRQALTAETIRRNAENDAARRAETILEDSKAKESALLESLDDVKRQITRQSTIIDEKEKEAGQLSGTHVELHAELSRLQQNRESKNQELNSLRKQLDQLRSSRDESRRQKVLADAILAFKTIARGVRGRLVDLCSVPNPKHTLACTVALGKHLDAIVVDTQESAMECIKYLKENRIGTMEFIPLNSLRDFDARHRPHGKHTRVIDCLKFEDDIALAVHYAVGQTLLSETMEEGRRIAYNAEDGRRHKVVTLDGSMLLKSGAMQGGSQTVRERARKWDEQSITVLRNKMNELETDLRGHSDLAETKLHSELTMREKNRELCLHTKDSAIRERGLLHKREKSLQLELQQCRKESVQAADTRSTVKARTDDIDLRIKSLQTKICAVESSIFEKFKKKTGIEDISMLETQDTKKVLMRAEERHRKMVMLARLRNQLESEKKRIGIKDSAPMERGLSSIEQDLKKKKEELKSLEKNVTSAEKNTENLNKELQTAQHNLSELEKEMRDITRRNSDVTLRSEQTRKRVSVIKLQCEKLRRQRTNIFNECVLEDITIPVSSNEKETTDHANASVGGKRRKRNVTDNNEMQEVSFSEPFQADIARKKGSARDKITIEFSDLPARLRTAHISGGYEKAKGELQRSLEECEKEMERLAPNMKAGEKLASSEHHLDDLIKNLEQRKDKARRALINFSKIREQRTAMFMNTFEQINDAVGRVYRELTEGTRAAGVHGSAYLTLDNQEEPYNFGTKYHATPPMKRFMGMEALSGGERTMAALALLFAMHSIRPAPFLVLDEVDAALDQANVQRLAQHIRKHSAACQFLVISLKNELFHRADSLIGVYKNKNIESSSVLTLDLTPYSE